MNKTEAIKRVEQMGEYERFVDEPISKKSVLNIVQQIDEPNPVFVPKFVVSWYEKSLNPLAELLELVKIKAKYENIAPDSYNDGMYKWIEETPNAALIVANMHQFGYEIMTEPLYTVEIPNPNNKGKKKTMLIKSDDNTIILGKGKEKPGLANFLTESEIKQDFEWAWQFAKPVEESK